MSKRAQVKGLPPPANLLVMLTLERTQGHAGTGTGEPRTLSLHPHPMAAFILVSVGDPEGPGHGPRQRPVLSALALASCSLSLDVFVSCTGGEAAMQVLSKSQSWPGQGVFLLAQTHLGPGTFSVPRGSTHSYKNQCETQSSQLPLRAPGLHVLKAGRGRAHCCPWTLLRAPASELCPPWWLLGAVTASVFPVDHSRQATPFLE